MARPLDGLVRPPGADPRLPIRNSAVYKDPYWLANYNGCSVFRLSNGLYYSPVGGSYATLEETREAIDEWHAAVDDERLAPGWEPPRR